VQFNQAGSYSVMVSNLVGATNSANAELTVIAPVCAPPASGIVAWWRGEGNTSDDVGASAGTMIGGAGFNTGEVGQGFAFNGASSYVSIPDSQLLDSFTNRLTVEFWFRANSTNANGNWATIVAKGGTSWRMQATEGAKTLTFSATGTSGGDLYGTRNVNDGQWHHVAGVYDSTNMFLYIDGTLDVSKPATGLIAQNDYPLAIGANDNSPSGVSYFFNGSVDEMALYNRGLSANEITAIYNAGSLGKCYTPTSPIIIAQPTNRMVFAGMPATFNVTATGTWPLSYQWSFNGTNLNNATNATLTLTNVQLSQAGNYAVTMTNLYGSTVSSNAILTVIIPVCAPSVSGIRAWWRGEGDVGDTVGNSTGIAVGGVGFDTGKVGQGFAFNGTSSYVSIPDSSLLDAFTNRLTVELWFRANSTNANPVWAAIVAKGNTSWRLQATEGAKTLTFSATGTSGGDMTGTRNVNDGQWHHVAGVYDGTTMSLYVDGTLDVSKPATGLIAQNDYPMAIGANDNSPAGTIHLFNGSVDEVALYNRALSVGEIATIYDAGSLGKCYTPAPTITTQPTSRTNVEGTPAIFSVTAYGAGQLSYQWLFNGTNLNNATNATLTLNSVQLSQAGNYAVAVTNLYGSATSSNAMLTVLVSACVPSASGIAGWWRGEGDASDGVGNNTGEAVGGAGFDAGKVSQGFSFNGSGGYVSIPDSPTLDSFSNRLTVEFWFRPNSTNANGTWSAIVAKGGTSWRVQGTSGAKTLTFSATGTSGGDMTGTRNVNDGLWHHAAGVYDGTNMFLYVDGTLDVSKAAAGLIAQNDYPMAIGANANLAAGTSYFFNGAVDEVTLYNRSLSASEIATIYNAGIFGKCYTPSAPIVLGHPTNRVIFAGMQATFSALAAGTWPLSYQWSFNGTNISNATNTTLTLTNVQLSQAGNYALTVTNLYGSATSSNAMLTVNAPVCAAPAAGIAAWWRGEGDAGDVMGASAGMLVGGAGFGAGEVGQSFSFNGTSSYVSITNLGLLNTFTNRLTVECWVRGNSTNANGSWGGIVAKGNTSWRIQATAGAKTVTFSLTGTTGADMSGTRNVNDGQWHHVAGVYDGTNMFLYVDGTLDVSKPSTGLIAQNNMPVAIGANVNPPPGTSYFFNGSVDEVALYNRGLSATEIAAIFNAGYLGKCFAFTSPTIVTQPASQETYVGGSAVFSVAVNGINPLIYQWQNSGTNIPGATNSTLTLSNVNWLQAGSYAVRITNLFGSTISSNALLAVYAHHFEWSAIPSPLTAKVPFAATLLAKDVANNIISNFTGTLSLSATTTNIVGANLDFEAGALSPWTPLNLGNQPGPYELASFDVDGDGNSSTAFRIVANSGTPDGITQNVLLIGGATYSVKLDIATDDSNDSNNGDGGTTTILIGGTTVAQFGWGGVSIHNIYRTNLTGSFTPPTTGTYPLKLTFYRDFFESGNLACLADDLRITSPGSTIGISPTNIFSFNNGIWNGSLTLLNPGTNIILVANDGHGHLGFSSLLIVTNPTPPIILIQPVGQIVLGGSNVTFSVGATGTAPLHYSWRKDAAALGGPSSASLTLSNVTRTNSGTYSVVITNVAGSVTSSNAVLLVRVPQQLGTPVLLPDGTFVLVSSDAGGGVPSAADLARFEVQASTNLVDWISLPGALTPTNGVLQFHDASVTNAPMRFYRIVEN